MNPFSGIEWGRLSFEVAFLLVLGIVSIYWIKSRQKPKSGSFMIKSETPSETSANDVINNLVDKMAFVVENSAKSNLQLAGAIQEFSANQKEIAVSMSHLSSRIETVQNDISGVKDDVKEIRLDIARMEGEKGK